MLHYDVEGDDLIAATVDEISKCNKILIFSGAGVSVESQLPAYRTPGAKDNIWGNNPESIGHIENFKNDEKVREQYEDFFFFFI